MRKLFKGTWPLVSRLRGYIIHIHCSNILVVCYDRKEYLEFVRAPGLISDGYIHSSDSGAPSTYINI